MNKIWTKDDLYVGMLMSTNKGNKRIEITNISYNMGTVEIETTHKDENLQDNSYCCHKNVLPIQIIINPLNSGEYLIYDDWIYKDYMWITPLTIRGRHNIIAALLKRILSTDGDENKKVVAIEFVDSIRYSTFVIRLTNESFYKKIFDIYTPVVRGVLEKYDKKYQIKYVFTEDSIIVIDNTLK